MILGVKSNESVVDHSCTQIVVSFQHPHEIYGIFVEHGHYLEVIIRSLVHESLITVAKVNQCLASDLHLGELKA